MATAKDRSAEATIAAAPSAAPTGPDAAAPSAVSTGSGAAAPSAAPGARSGDRRPRGFGAAIATLADWDREGRATVCEGWTLDRGDLGDWLTELRVGLPIGASLLLDLGHVLGASACREAFEGRAHEFDPRPRRREHRFGIEEVVTLCGDAGFAVRDLVEVDLSGERMSREAVEALCRAGLQPTRRLYRAPGERLWIRAERCRVAPGSVLLARRGDEAALARSKRALAAILPAAWEIVDGPCGDCEQESWNEAVPRSRGERLWLLREGDEPDKACFEALRLESYYAPVRPADREARGLSGLMVERGTLMEVGPLPREPRSALVAGEEWVLRASACNRRVRELDCGAGTRFAPTPRSDEDAALATELFERWRVVDEFDDRRILAEVETPPWEREGREPRISLCMIARDEEGFLPACLDAAKDAVDEIVLVDTGSTDRTVAIAEAHGARVLHRPWDEDFSAPRNLGLAQATGDWILVLDADEVLEPGAAARIRTLARCREACGYHLRFVNSHEDGRTQGITMVRLFRRLPDIEYRYAIHEQVVPSLVAAAEPRGLVLLNGRVEVVHHGYSDECMQARNKRERNLALFARQLEDDPEDLYCLYKYGDFLRQLGEPAERVLEVFERAFALLLAQPPLVWREMPFAGEIAALLALELVRQGRVDEADEVVGEGLRRFVPTPNLHYLAAGIAAGRGRPLEALAQYRHCLGYAGRTLVVPVQEGTTSWIALAGIGEARALIGDLERAEECLRMALDLAPDWGAGNLRLGGLLLSQGRVTEAAACLGRATADPDLSDGAREHFVRLCEANGIRLRGDGPRATTDIPSTDPRPDTERAGRPVPLKL